MSCSTVVIISRCAATRASLHALISQAGLDVELVSSLDVWQQGMHAQFVGCVVLDTTLGDLNEVARIASLAAVCALTPVVLLTDVGDVPTAVQAIRQGAVDVIQKPIQDRLLVERIQEIVAARP